MNAYYNEPPFMRFRCILHMFYLDVAKVDLALHILQNVYTCMLQLYVSNVSVVFKCMLQVVYQDVASVALAIHVRCKCMFSNIAAVLNVCCKCFIWMLHMLQWPYTYVASVCFKCFSRFKCMLQVFCLDVTYVTVVIQICCNSMF
jgi:hypothetical protein